MSTTEIVITVDNQHTWGSSIKDVRTNLGIFGTPLPLSRPVHIRLTTPSPCPCGDKAGIIWNIATCEQFTLKGKKKLIILILDVHTCVFLLDNFDNSIPKDGFTLRSIYSLLNTSRMKILFTDILPNYLSKFHKYGSYNFFSKRTSTFG